MKKRKMTREGKKALESIIYQELKRLLQEKKKLNTTIDIEEMYESLYHSVRRIMAAARDEEERYRKRKRR